MNDGVVFDASIQVNLALAERKASLLVHLRGTLNSSSRQNVTAVARRMHC